MTNKFNIAGKQITNQLEESAKAHRQKLALRYKDTDYTYDRLFREIEDLSNLLHERSPSINYPIGLYFKNCPEFIIGYYALVKSGIVAMLVDHSWKRDELKNVVKDCHLGGFLIHKNELFRFPLCDMFPFIMQYGNHCLLYSDEHYFNRPFYEDRLSLIVSCRFSSGTTGTPKCMMYAAENIIAAALNWKSTINMNANDRILCLANFTHGLAFNTSMLAPLSVGASIFMTDSLMPRHVAQLLEKQAITILVAFPVFYSLMAESQLKDKYHLETLRLCVSSGTILHSEVKRKFKENVGIRIADLYGVAETGLCILNNTDNIESIGTALRNVEIAIMAADGRKLTPLLEGQIAIKTRSRARGYYNFPGELEEKVTHDGFYMSGDIGYMDELGRVYVKGRMQDFIDVAGKKVDPKEIEDVLLQIPDIREAVAFSQKSHKTRSEVLCIALVTTKKMSRSEITDHVQQYLSPYKIPQRIYFLDSFPRNSSGKILRGELSKLTADEQAK